MRKIGVVTVARSDYGIYLPVLRKIQADPELELQLFVSGAHLLPAFGLTVDKIEEDGFRINQRINMLLPSDLPEGIAKSMGQGTIGFARAYVNSRPDILVVLGDRFEMHSAALAALPFKIPVAHIHGGAVTEGAIDDALRHSMTKMSHIHFVSTKEYARRVMQLGEEPWRVILTGAPSLDNLSNIKLLDRRELARRFKISLEKDFLLVTYHPVTLQYEQTDRQIKELLAALDHFDMQILFTMPNEDTSGGIIREMIKTYVSNHPSSQVVECLGTQGYFSVMSQATAMVGNSSSGIVEAPSFKLPVVNIGIRQKGKIRCANVIDVANQKADIIKEIQKAISKPFRKSLESMRNSYGDGHASDRIVEKLKDFELNDRLLVKSFVDYKLDVDLSKVPL